MLLTSRAIAAKKFGIARWALTLAPSVVGPARRIRPLGRRGLGAGSPPALGAAAAVPPALGLAIHATLGGAAVLPAGPPAPPSAGGGAALGATISSLGVGGSEELLASLEETAPPSGPASPLTGPGLAANVVWAQGSGELPTAKPRARSPLHFAPRRLYGSSSPPDRDRPSNLRPVDPASKPPPVGATWPKRSHFGLAPVSPKKWYPPGPILTSVWSARGNSNASVPIIPSVVGTSGSCRRMWARVASARPTPS